MGQQSIILGENCLWEGEEEIEEKLECIEHVAGLKFGIF